MNGEGMNWFQARLFVDAGWAVRRDIWSNTTLAEPDVLRWVLFHNNLYYICESDGAGGSSFRVVTKEDFGANEFNAKDWTVHPVGCYIQSADVDSAFEEFAAGAEGQPFPRSILNPNLHFGACSGSSAPDTLLPDGGDDFGSLPNPGPVNDQGWNNNGNLPGAPNGGGNAGGGGGGGGSPAPERQQRKNQAPATPEVTITATLWAVDDNTSIPSCISNPTMSGRNKYTYDISIQLAPTDYAPYQAPWWGTFSYSPNMDDSGINLALKTPGEERFTLAPGGTHNIIGVDVWLESRNGTDPAGPLNTATFKADCYLPGRRVNSEAVEYKGALGDCEDPPIDESPYGSGG